MLSALEEAKEREDYGLYLSVGNEMIGYYRSVSQFQKAYRISEDMLLYQSGNKSSNRNE